MVPMRSAIALPLGSDKRDRIGREIAAIGYEQGRLRAQPVIPQPDPGLDDGGSVGASLVRRRLDAKVGGHRVLAPAEIERGGRPGGGTAAALGGGARRRRVDERCRVGAGIRHPHLGDRTRRAEPHDDDHRRRKIGGADGEGQHVADRVAGPGRRDRGGRHGVRPGHAGIVADERLLVWVHLEPHQHRAQFRTVGLDGLGDAGQRLRVGGGCGPLRAIGAVAVGHRLPERAATCLPQCRRRGRDDPGGMGDAWQGGEAEDEIATVQHQRTLIVSGQDVPAQTKLIASGETLPGWSSRYADPAGIGTDPAAQLVPLRAAALV